MNFKNRKNSKSWGYENERSFIRFIALSWSECAAAGFSSQAQKEAAGTLVFGRKNWGRAAVYRSGTEWSAGWMDAVSRSGDTSPGVIQQTASQPDDRLQSLLESRPAPGAYGFYRALCLMIFCIGNTGFTSITRSTPWPARALIHGFWPAQRETMY